MECLLLPAVLHAMPPVTLPPVTLPLELWHIVCEYLPFNVLQYFNLPSNKILYNCIKQHYPKILYDESVNYFNMLQQLINLKTNFVMFSFVDLYKPCLTDPYLVVIKNNSNYNKKTLFTISKFVQYVNYYFVFKRKRISADFLNLSIKNLQLNFTCSKMYGTYVAECRYQYPLQTLNINGIKICCPAFYCKFSDEITDYNFVLEDSDVEQIYKNIFINGRVMSSFIKDGIPFYIMAKI